MPMISSTSLAVTISGGAKGRGIGRHRGRGERYLAPLGCGDLDQLLNAMTEIDRDDAALAVGCCLNDL